MQSIIKHTHIYDDSESIYMIQIIVDMESAMWSLNLCAYSSSSDCEPRLHSKHHCQPLFQKETHLELFYRFFWIS